MWVGLGSGGVGFSAKHLPGGAFILEVLFCLQGETRSRVVKESGWSERGAGQRATGQIEKQAGDAMMGRCRYNMSRQDSSMFRCQRCNSLAMSDQHGSNTPQPHVTDVVSILRLRQASKAQTTTSAVSTYFALLPDGYIHKIILLIFKKKEGYRPVPTYVVRLIRGEVQREFTVWHVCPRAGGENHCSRKVQASSCPVGNRPPHLFVILYIYIKIQ